MYIKSYYQDAHIARSNGRFFLFFFEGGGGGGGGGVRFIFSFFEKFLIGDNVNG